jgi:hypothetical protein
MDGGDLDFTEVVNLYSEMSCTILFIYRPILDNNIASRFNPSDSQAKILGIPSVTAWTSHRDRREGDRC